MACKIIYNGKTFEESDFIRYYNENRTTFPEGDFLQLQEGSKANLPTLSKVKEWLKRIGVDIKTVSEITVNGKKIGANGIARVSANLIEILNGKEEQALTEEAMHMAVELVEKYNPSLYKQMFNKIGQYGMMQSVLDEYKNIYTLPDGKVDIIRIKKEAIAKLLTETLIRQNQGITEKPELLAHSQTWWGRVKEWLKSLFGKSDYNPFEEIARKVGEGTLSPERQALVQEAKSLKEQITPVYLQDVFNDNPIEFLRMMGDQLYSSPSEAKTASEMLGPRLTEIAYKLFPRTNQNFFQIAKSVIEKADSNLDNYLLDFLKPFGVRSKEFDELKTKLGIDALGATDIINKLIWLRKDRNIDTVPEEFGHMITMLMGENHPIIKDLLSEITNWSEFRQIREQYLPIYGNEKQVRIEAIGKLIAQSLVKNYKTYNTNKTLLNKALELLKEFFSKLLNGREDLGDLVDYPSKLGDKIALDVLAGNNIVDLTIPMGSDRVNFDRAIKNNPSAQRVINTFTTGKYKDFKITGSIAISKQGTVYRNTKEPIHDVDFIAYGNDEKLEEVMEDMDTLGGVPLHNGWTHPEYVTYSFVIPPPGTKIVNIVRDGKGWMTGYDVEGDTKGEQPVMTDFFWYSHNPVKEAFGEVANFSDVFKGKLYLSKNPSSERMFQREKDQRDFVLFKPSFIGTNKPEFTYYQINSNSNKDKQTTIVNDLLEKAKHIVKKEVNGESFYEVDGKKVARRVTDLAKNKFNNMFKDKQLNKTDLQKAIDELKKEKGTAGHSDMEDIFHRYVNEDGFLRPSPLSQTQTSKMSPDDNSTYEILEKNLAERLSTFPQGTRFFSELMIYDAKKDEAGTIDFLAVEPEGKTHILDWKFIEVNVNKTEDVPWYKADSFKLQIGEYKRILKERYNIKEEDFGQTRAIPIRTKYSYVDPYDKSQGLKLDTITIGNVDPTKESAAYLLPVSLEEESTGNSQKDILIRKLNALHKELTERKIQEGRKDIKAAQLNSLYTAIRQLQLKDNLEPLIEQATALLAAHQKLLDRYRTEFANKTHSDFSEKEIEAFADLLRDSTDDLRIYTTLGVEFDGVLDAEKDKDIISKINDITAQATLKQAKSNIVIKEFVDKFIVQRVGIQNFLSPERVLKGLKKWFRSFSQAGTKAVEAFYKIETPLRQRALLESDTQNKILLDIRERYLKWAKDKGLTPRNMFSLITKKDKEGRYVHERTDKISKEFYMEFNKRAELGEKQWFKDNVDIEAYRAYYEKYKAEKFEQIDNQTYNADPKLDNERKKQEKDKIEFLFDIKNDSAWGNNLMKKFPQGEKWYSNEYKELLKPENAPALEWYNYIGDRVGEAAKAGAIESRRAGRFLPFMRKNTLDKIVFGGNIRVGESFMREISIDEGDVGYGNINRITGEIIPTIPFYFKTDLGREVYDKDGNFSHLDYSDVSTDLFELMMMFNNQLTNYQYRTSIESQIQLLLRAERLKGSLRTNNHGEAVRENGKIIPNETNEANAEYLEKFIKNRLYGQRYVDSEHVDQTLGKVGNKAAKAINKFFGREILPEDLAERQISATKVLDAGNRWFQQKVLGLNVSVPLANLAGGTMQVMLNSGRYATKTDFAAGWFRVVQQNFKTEEGIKYAGLLDYFLPMLEDETRRKARHSSVSNVTKFALSDFLMSIQRGSDKLVQYPLAIALMENTMVEDGKFVNIRQEVKRRNDWSDRYNKFPIKADREEFEKKIEEEINALKRERGLPKIAKVVDDHLVIPGIERESIAVGNFREFIQQQAKNAVGNATQEDPSLMKMNVIYNSFMVFKNWIPRLVEVRTGELRYQAGTDSWEYGRMRMMAKVLFSNILGSISNVRGIIVGNERGVNLLKEIYQKKADQWEKATGTKIELNEGEFIDIYREGVKAELRELQMLFSLAGIFLALKAAAPDDDEADEVKGFYKWSLRAWNKIEDELRFYYDPISLNAIANGSILPSLGILTDVMQLVRHTSMEGFGLTMEELGYEELGAKVREKAKPQKYWMRTFPITKELSTYIPIFNKDLADEMGISISTQPRQR